MRLPTCGIPVHNGAMTSMVPPISTSMEADIFIELLFKRHLMVEMLMTDFRQYTDLVIQLNGFF